jgi:RND family efflux transporter MFP subunit
MIARLLSDTASQSSAVHIAMPLVAAIVLLALPDGAHAQDGPRPANVWLEPARIEQVDIRRDVIGRIEAVARSRVASEEEGRVVALLVDRGDRVTAGDTLARLDDTLVRIDLERARSVLAARQAAARERAALLEKTERDKRRVERLVDRGSATTSELEDAETDRTAAEARLRLAEADVASARQDIARLSERLADMTITAPFAGRVVEKSAELGEWIGQGDVVAEIVRLDAVDVVVDVPERFVGAVQRLADRQRAEHVASAASTTDVTGSDATSETRAAPDPESPAAPRDAIVVTVDALNETFVAERVTVIASGDPLARTFPVRLRVRNDRERMKPGMSVSASVPTGASGEMLTVNKDAVLRSDTGPYVFIDEGGAAGVRSLDIVFGVGQRVAVRPGPIQPGTMVVVEGNERLRPRQPLRVMNGANGEEPNARTDDDDGDDNDPQSVTRATNTGASAERGADANRAGG